MKIRNPFEQFARRIVLEMPEWPDGAEAYSVATSDKTLYSLGDTNAFPPRKRILLDGLFGKRAISQTYGHARP
jgi:hypothetical protein